MTNSILIHLNRKFKVPLESIISITQKKHGSIWVRFHDPKSKSVKIAVAKVSLPNLLMIINNYRVMAGKQPMLAIYEK